MMIAIVAFISFTASLTLLTVPFTFPTFAIFTNNLFASSDIAPSVDMMKA
jgi:hypothetical protein